VQDASLQQLAREVDGKFVSGFVRAVKPSGAQKAAAAVPAQAASGCGCAPRCCG
jgi:hypothetical protein